MGCICSCYQKNYNLKHKTDKSRQIENDIDLYTTNSSIEPFNRSDAILPSTRMSRILSPVRDNIDDTYLNDSTNETISGDGLFISFDDTITDSGSFSGDNMDLLSYVSFDREQSGDKIYMDDDNCVICADYFDDSDHRTVLLPCGHMFCLQCITVLAFKRHYRCMECPIDRLTHQITRFRIKEQDNARFTNTTIIENKVAFGMYVGSIDLEDGCYNSHPALSCTGNSGTNTNISMSMSTFDSVWDSASDRTETPDYTPISSRVNSSLSIDNVAYT